MSEIHRIKCGNVNCYIIENGTTGILVDTGKAEFIDKVIALCKFYHAKLIVLTHAHFDHAENAAKISDELGIPIGMNENDCNLIQSNTNQSLSAVSILGKIVLLVSLKEFSVRSMPDIKPNIVLHHHDNLSDYGINARIISLLGHTDGSIGIDVDNKHLIVGDALMNMFYPTVSMLHDRLEVMVQSYHGNINHILDELINVSIQAYSANTLVAQ